MKENMTNITLTVVYDNNKYDPKFKTGFGFGCVIKTQNKTILFDTGGDSPTLLENLETANINPKDIDIVFLSHIHGDHTGGLLGFLEKNNKVKVYAPSSFPSSFKEKVKSVGAVFIDVSDFTKIDNNFYSTGELHGPPEEHSLIIDSSKGLIIVTGCSHPGIINIIKKAKQLINKNVYLVIGGFHHPPISVAREFRELGVEKVAPCHCTGEPTINAFKENYKNNYIKTGIGKKIIIKKN